MSKRSATTDLNHENWDKEEEPEEAGVFQKASSEILETRIIRTAKRRAKLSDTNLGPKSSPFSGFSCFGNTSTTISSPFSFLSQNKPKPVDEVDKNGTKSETSSPPKDAQTQLKPFANSFLSSGQPKDSSNFSFGSTQKTSTETTFKPFEHIFKQSKPPTDEKDKKTKDLEMLKDLNLSCSSWIAEHLEKNPYCILTPIFKDYEKHLAQLDLKTQEDDKEQKSESSNKLNFSNSNPEVNKSINVSKEESSETKSPDKEKETEANKDSKTEEVQPIKPLNLPLANTNTTFGAPSTFSLNQIAAKPATDPGSETKTDAEESEEPPKNEVVPVVEEDSIFDVKCKVFFKRDNDFISRGIGTLYLKPVKNSKKTQLVVRAFTNLGNIILNFLLSPDLPIQKMGENHMMFICVPTPDSKPPPIPVMLKVKAADQCEALLKKVRECIAKSI